MISRQFSIRYYSEKVRSVLGSMGVSNVNIPWHQVIKYILAIGVGCLGAVLIIIGYWPVALGLVLIAPAIILLTSYPYAIFIIWLFITPFLQNTSTEQLRTVYWVIYRALPPLAVGILFLTNRLRIDSRRRLSLNKFDIIAPVGFLVWAIANIFWYHTSGVNAYLYTLYDQSFIPICIYWWIRLLAPSEKDLKKIIPGAFILVIFEVCVGVLSWVSPGSLPRDWVGYIGERTIGTLRFPHAYTLTLIFFFLLLFQAAMNSKPRISRFILLAVVGIGAFGVFLSYSRGAWLGGALAWVGLVFLYHKTVLRITASLLVVVTILGSSVLRNQVDYAQERMSSGNTAMLRLVIWDAGIQMIQQKPIFGWGFGDYKQYAGKFQRVVRDIVANNQEASHNTFISYAAELGVPGLFLYLLPAMWLLAKSFIRWRSLPSKGFWDRRLLVIFWLFLTAFGVVSFFSDIRTSTYGLSLWWMTLAWIATMIEPLRPLSGEMPLQH